MPNFNIPPYGGNLPFFLYDIDNFQLITTPTIPGDIRDQKDIFLVETRIPGLNFQPVQPTGANNRRISMTIPIIKRNNSIGNLILLKQFHLLRNQKKSLVDIFKNTQFQKTPQVLYNWGIGSVPLVYWVKRCEIVQKAGFTNALGNPQFSNINIELLLDEQNPIYKAEEVFRYMTALLGQVAGLADSADSQVGAQRVY